MIGSFNEPKSPPGRPRRNVVPFLPRNRVICGAVHHQSGARQRRSRRLDVQFRGACHGVEVERIGVHQNLACAAIQNLEPIRCLPLCQSLTFGKAMEDIGHRRPTCDTSQLSSFFLKLSTAQQRHPATSAVSHHHDVTVLLGQLRQRKSHFFRFDVMPVLAPNFGVKAIFMERRHMAIV